WDLRPRVTRARHTVDLGTVRWRWDVVGVAPRSAIDADRHYLVPGAIAARRECDEDDGVAAEPRPGAFGDEERGRRPLDDLAAPGERAGGEAEHKDRPQYLPHSQEGSRAALTARSWILCGSGGHALAALGGTVPVKAPGEDG